MSRPARASLFALRVALGWIFLYSGFTKVINPDWTAAGYVQGAKTFAGFYQWLLLPDVLPAVNFLNAWGQLLIGAALLLGIFVRLASVFGILLMLLYYLPVLDWPRVGKTAYLVDEHVIYALVFAALGVFRAGRAWGLELWCLQLPLCAKYPKLRTWLG